MKVTQGFAGGRGLQGLFTRFGEVAPLLTEGDDRYVVMAPGDEITVRFDATRLPQLPAGWTRDFLIYTEGWIKDADLNTAFGATSGPLPFWAMASYPYAPGEDYPEAEQAEYLTTYHTRRLTR